MKSKEDLGAYIIMYAVQNNKGDVTAILLKNGVVAPSNLSDIEVGLIVTEMLKKSKAFERDFTKLVQSNDVVSGLTLNMSGMYSNMSGFSNATGGMFTAKEFDPISEFGFDPSKFSMTTQSPLLNSTSKPSNSTSSNTTSSNTPSKISAFEKYLLLGQGLFSDFTKMKENEAKVKLADASLELRRLENQEGASVNKSSSKTLFVILGLVSVGLLGFITYKMTKK